MRKLMYTILAILVMILIILFVSPYFIGARAQQLVLNNINTLNTTPAYSNYINITLEKYQRHWFSSDAQIKITFHTPPTAIKKFSRSAIYQTTIKHGPLFLIDHHSATRLHWGAGAVLIEDHSANFDGVFGALLSWHGKPILFAHIANLLMHDPLGNNYSFDHIAFDTQGNPDKEIRYIFSIDAFNAHMTNLKQPAIVTMHHMRIITNGHKSNTLWLNTGHLAVDTLTISAIGNNMTTPNAIIPTPIAIINNLTVDTDTRLTKDKTKVNSSVNFNIDSLNIMQKTIKPITLRYSINGIDAKILQQLKTVSTQNQQTQPLQLVMQILQSGFTFKIDKLYVGLPQDLASSPLSAQAELRIQPDDEAMKKIQAIVAQVHSSAPTELPAGESKNQPLDADLARAAPLVLNELIKTVIATGQASIPHSLIEQGLFGFYAMQLTKLAAVTPNITQTPQELSTQAYNYLVQNKMLIPNNDGSMSFAFTLNHGQLLINGNTPAFDLPQPTSLSAKTTISLPMGH